MGVSHWTGVRVAGFFHVYAFDPPRFYPFGTGAGRIDERHSFRWGDDSPGSADLARAILRSVCDEPSVTELLAYDFLDLVVARLPLSWTLTRGEVEAWLCDTHHWEIDTARDAVV